MTKIRKQKTLPTISKAEKMQLKREKIFQDKNYWKAIFKMVFPTMLATLITASYQVIDKIITTNFATNYIINLYKEYDISHDTARSIINIAMNYASVVMAMAFAFSLLISIGTSIKCSIALGQKNEQLVKENVGTGIILSLALGTILTIGMWFLAPIIIQFQSSSKIGEELWKTDIIKNEALKYSHMVILGIILLFGANFWIMLFRSEGRIFTLIFLSLLGLVLNIALDFALVFKFGLIGTGFGSLIVWLANIVIALFIVYKSGSHFRIKLIHLKFKPRLAIGILSLGVVSLLENITEALIIMTTARLIHYLPAPSGWNNDNIPVYVSLSSGIGPWLIILNAPIIGLGYGARALIAYAYGQRNFKKIWNYMWRLFLFLFAMLSILIILLSIFSAQMLMIFGVAPNIAHHFKSFMILQFGFYPLASFSYVGIILFQSTNRAKLALFFGMQRTIVMPIICLLLGFYSAQGLHDGFYYYLFIGFIDLFSSIVLIPILGITVYKNRRYILHNN